jgi:trans-L-3-hydroxyproline dehydratase
VITIRTIDAHVAGAPLRLVVDGFPSLPGRSMKEKRAWAARRADRIRRVLMLEPRGHADMAGAVLTEPTQPGSDAGLLFMDNDGFGALSGHSVIAAATIAISRGVLIVRDDRSIVFDTVAGPIRVSVDRDADDPARIDRVSFKSVPSFVLAAGVDVPLAGRRLRADIAFAGQFYAIVDAESAGVVIDGAHLGDLRRLGVAIAAALDAAPLRIVHPLDSSAAGLSGTIFTAPPQATGADLRNATVSAGGSVDRSPGGTATAAVMAVLDAMGLLTDTGRFVHEGLTGQLFEGLVAGRTRVDSHEAVVAEIQGSAHITGEHTFIVDDRDPFQDGMRLN